MLHHARMIGRALALLAAMMLVLLPALPSHAHAHAVGADIVQAHPHGKVTGAADQADRGDAGDIAGHGADCCFLCHVSVLPGGETLPTLVSHLRERVWSPSGVAPPDVLTERLPEPPRSIA